MSRFVRASALAAARCSLRHNPSLTPSLLLASRVSSASFVSALPSSSSSSLLRLPPVRSAHEMARPSASSPPSSLQKPQRGRGKAALPQRVTNPKKTTWIAGVAVVPNAREVLLSLYEETLRKVDSYDVKDAYNAHLIQLTKYRQGIVQRESEVEAIEAAISSGQIEELIEDAEAEFDLLVAMNESIKPWEADEEGDAAFTEYHPSFGQEKKHFVIEHTAEEKKAFDELDGQTGGSGAGGAGEPSAAASTQPQPAPAATAAAKA